ncbi:MAG TPA: type II toxin-antitoxin system PemK/MazF family toxin [Candidatus Diapherotrites archaeon]|nr:type II toxin-antitoxin system PemK/MazF family toxin [Candidatus Diapherotrites archaeon]
MGKIEAKVGQVVLIDFPFIDNTSSKVRPALVLFSEYGNIILAAITSNKKASGIKLTKADGLLYDSTIKLNAIFTLPKEMIIMHICDLNQAKRKEVYLKLEEMIKGFL